MQINWKGHFKSTFFKNFYIVLSGSVLSQLVVVFTTPILSRIYSPEEFGAASVFFSLAGFFTILSTLQYEGAIMLPKRNIDAISLVWLSSILSWSNSLILLIVMFVFQDQFLNVFHMKSMSRLWLWIPITVLIYSHYSILSNWVTRLSQYKTIAYRHFFQSVSQSVTKIVLGKLSFVSIGLIVGTLVGVLASLFILLKGRFRDMLRLIRNMDWLRMKKNAKKYDKFPKYTLLQGLMDTFQESVLLLVISMLYGNIKLGIYSFTFALLQKPLQVVGSSLGQVYYQDISKKFADHQEIHSDTLKLLKILAMAALAVYMPIVFFGPWLFDFFFGDVWWESGEIAQIMSIWLMLKLISSPISSVPNVTGHQRTYFVFTLVMNILPLMIFSSGYWLNWNFHQVVYTNYLLLSIFLVFYIRWILTLTRGTSNFVNTP
jgi:lipopolysaccharide exporter